MKLKLTGAQNRVLTLPIKNPIQIKGVAGSGKTTVAVCRAKHVAASSEDLFRQTRVQIFSYNKNLVKFIRKFLVSSEERSRVSVSTIHSWAYQYLKGCDFWRTRDVASKGTTNEIILHALMTLKQQHPGRSVLLKSLEFYVQEISWMKGRRIFKKQNYLDVKRTGRGTRDRVTTEDRDLLWGVYYYYTHTMSERSIVDYDDYANIAISYIDSDPAFKQPYSHIVVDEAQDLSSSQLLLISKLVNPETNSITIVADAAQKIYKSGFSWSDVGINVRGGRSVEFKRNYRNTQQIAEAAISLLAHDPQPAEFSEHIIPEREGELPEILELHQRESQIEELLKRLDKVDLQTESFVVLHRMTKGVEAIHATLCNRGFSPVKISQSNDDLKDAGLYICTMSSIKGLECDHVVLCDLNEGVLPYSKGFAEADDEQHIITERRLLYTCMTRARKTLVMIATATPSRYLSEIESSKVRRM